MRVLILVVAAVAPVMFAQARGGSRPAPGRRGPSVATPRTAAPAARPGFAPVNVTGYVAGYVTGYAAGYAPLPYPYAPAAPLLPPAAPPDPNAPPPAYYGADPSGQGYPTILVNPNYTPQTSNPVMRDYSYLSSDSQPQAAPTASVYFLIAMKDHVIYPAVAYWVENDTLNYISQQGKRTQAPLSQVDRDFSTQLNKERNVDFALPAVTTN